MATLRTKLCDVFDIKYPIIQAGMGYVAYAELAAAVSNAGGMGTLGAASWTPEEMEEQFRKVRRLTNKPFCVDLVFPSRAATVYTDGLKIPDPPPAPMRELWAELEAKGIALDHKIADPVTDTYMGIEMAKKKAELILEERPAAIASGLGTPEWLVKEAHARGVKIISLVGRVKDALRVEAMGADVIVAQGHEAGGHTGRIATFVLIPQIADAVKVPVMAAGGIGTGRHLVASFALGAVGVWVGTRFIAAKESGAHPVHKQKVLQADENLVPFSKVYDGLGHRHVKTRIDEVYEGRENEILDFPHQRALTGPIYHKARELGLGDYLHMSCGQIAVMVKEEETAAEIVRKMVEEAVYILKEKFPAEVKLD